jgi:menaquinone-dependent protoporphyrinogen IX oxidase
MNPTKPKRKTEEPAKKMDNKTLIAYVTKGGATGEAANLIANTLREKNGLEVDVVNLRKQPNPDLSAYRNVVVGGGVRMGKVYKEALSFLNQDLGGKRFAFFICSGAAGNPLHHDDIANKYITKEMAKHPNVQLVAMEAFGGCIRILGRALTDRRDSGKIKTWAEELGKKLAE